MVTIILANLANAFFNWVLIFGNLGFPDMGAVGSGWASSLSRWLMLVGLLGLSWPLLKECSGSSQARHVSGRRQPPNPPVSAAR